MQQNKFNRRKLANTPIQGYKELAKGAKYTSRAASRGGLLCTLHNIGHVRKGVHNQRWA